MESQISARCTAVTFDFWNTLAAERPGYMRGLRIERSIDELALAGIDVDQDRLGASIDSAFRRHGEFWQANSQFVAADALDHVIEELGILPDVALRERLKVAFELEATVLDLETAPGIGDALDALRLAEMKIGIICDVGFTPSVSLRAFLDKEGLLEYFDGWSFSDEVGHYKPSPVIFRHALSGLGAQPATTAHVGDLRRTDVAGALSFGMRAVRYRGINDDRSDAHPEAHAVISHHRELDGVLGG